MNRLPLSPLRTETLLELAELGRPGREHLRVIDALAARLGFRWGHYGTVPQSYEIKVAR